jgi:hypothetical protein
MYMRSFDPDNTVYQGGSYATVNTIKYTFAAGDGKCRVQATPTTNDPFVTRFQTSPTIYYESTDPRAGVYYGGFANYNPYTYYPSTLSLVKGSTRTADEAIGIIFALGDLAPGASTGSFTYTTALTTTPLFTVGDSTNWYPWIYEGTTYVGKVTAVGYTRIEATGGVDIGFFGFDQATGDLNFLSARDYENPVDSNRDNIYEIEFTATSAQNDVTTLRAHVIVVNSPPPSFTSGSTFSVVENSVAVTTVTWTSAYSATVAISGGPDAAFFTVDGTTGVLDFISAPDFESPLDSDGNNEYWVRLTVTDTDGATATKDISVRVVNIPAPYFTSDSTLAILEGEVFVVTVAATSTSLAEYPLSLAISGGADGALFTLDPVTWDLSFSSPPDYELPSDSNMDNVYEVTLTVTGEGSTNLDVVVTVTDNPPPVFTSPSTATLQERTDVLVGTVTATSAIGSPIVLAKAGGADAALFSFDAGTGVLNFISSPDYDNPTDSDGNNVYELTISATTDISVYHTIFVTITDIPPPVITFDPPTVSIEESSTFVGSITATLENSVIPITWSISGPDAALFSIDATTGSLSFISAPDYETPLDSDGDNLYEVDVTATADGTDVITLYVSVTDVYGPPVITSLPNAIWTRGASFVILDIIAVDGESDPGSNSFLPTFSIVGGADSGVFSITNAGVLSFVGAPVTAADSNGDDIWEVEVRATGGFPVEGVAIQLIFVSIGPNNPPVFQMDETKLTVQEGTTLVTTLEAFDWEDPDSVLLYRVTGGPDRTLFTIEGDQLFFKDPLMALAPGEPRGDIYLVEVTVFDFYGFTDTVTLRVKVVRCKNGEYNSDVEECDLLLDPENCLEWCKCAPLMVPDHRGACTYCGNGFREERRKEKCDTWLDKNCAEDCSGCLPDFVFGPDGKCTRCGNGKLDLNLEICDSSLPNCSEDCQSCAEGHVSDGEGACTTCGNGKLDPGEICDAKSEKCSSDCRGCAPGFVVRSLLIDPTGSCTKCGNGKIDNGEICDFGSDYFCNSECSGCTEELSKVDSTGKCSRCGNGYLDAGEACDSLRAGCSPDCKSCKEGWVPSFNKWGFCTTCGNGRVEPDEVCDVKLEGAKCLADCSACAHPYTAIGRRCVLCGNGRLDVIRNEDGEAIYQEQCDAAQPGCQGDCTGCSDGWRPSGLPGGACVPDCDECCHIQARIEPREVQDTVRTSDAHSSFSVMLVTVAIFWTLHFIYK